MTKPDDTNEIWQRDEIESPCIKICVIHPETRLCMGCLRSIDEIGTWSQLTPKARQEVLDELPGRTKLIHKRRGGRAARLKR